VEYKGFMVSVIPSSYQINWQAMPESFQLSTGNPLQPGNTITMTQASWVANNIPAALQKWAQSADRPLLSYATIYSGGLVLTAGLGPGQVPVFVPGSVGSSGIMLPGNGSTVYYDQMSGLFLIPATCFNYAAMPFLAGEPGGGIMSDLKSALVLSLRVYSDLQPLLLAYGVSQLANSLVSAASNQLSAPSVTAPVVSAPAEPAVQSFPLSDTPISDVPTAVQTYQPPALPSVQPPTIITDPVTGDVTAYDPAVKGVGDIVGDKVTGQLVSKGVSTVVGSLVKAIAGTPSAVAPVATATPTPTATPTATSTPAANQGPAPVAQTVGSQTVQVPITPRYGVAANVTPAMADGILKDPLMPAPSPVTAVTTSPAPVPIANPAIPLQSPLPQTTIAASTTPMWNGLTNIDRFLLLASIGAAFVFIRGK
jgi:hypothetical protein